MVYLNGVLVDDANISPDRHRFVGVFRESNYLELYARLTPCDVIRCSCGHSLWTREGFYEHYLKGHFDINMYVDIEVCE